MTPKERAKKILQGVYGCGKLRKSELGYECPDCIERIGRDFVYVVDTERERCVKALRRCIAPLMERCQEIPGGMVYTSMVAETLSKAEIALRNPPAESEVPG